MPARSKSITDQNLIPSSITQTKRSFVLPVECEDLKSCSRETAKYVQRFERFQLAESAHLLVDGRQAFPEMLSGIDSSTKSVDMETYTFCADRTGRRFQESLRRAARRGVQVRLIYDYIGSLGIPDRFVREMVDDGVNVSVYHPLILSRPSWAINRRDHRKILIIDQIFGFTGGINISDEYVGPEEGGKGWRDTHVRLDGQQVALWMQQLYEYSWRHSTPYYHTRTNTMKLRAGIRRHFMKPVTIKTLAKTAAAADLHEKGKVAVQILGNREFHCRRRIHQAYLHAIQNARFYVLIENAYFIPDGHVREALAQAVKRGVTVAMVVAKNGDVPIAAYASRNLYNTLLESGVRIFEWPRAMMHAKTAVIDDAWAIVGSYNFDSRSLFHQLEAVAVIADPIFARRLREQTMTDITQCEEVTLEQHKMRPWYRRLLEPAAYLLHYWL